MKYRAILLVNVSTLLWSGNVVLGRAIRDDIGPWSLAGYRATVAAIIFVLILAVKGQSWRQRDVEPREWGLLALMGLLGVVGFQVLQYSALHYTTAINVGIISATFPVVTFLLSLAILKQRFGALQLLGAALSLAGVAIVISRGSLDVLWSINPNFGDLLILSAVFAWGLYSVIARILLRTRPTLWVTAVSTAMAVPMLLVPVAVETATSPPVFSLKLLLAILYVGVGPSCIAFLTWNEGVRQLGPNGAAAFINTLPLFTVALAALVLGEVPGVYVTMGALIIIPGCLIAALCSPKEVAA